MSGTILEAITVENIYSALKKFIFWLGWMLCVFKCYNLKPDKKTFGVLIANQIF